MEIKSAILEAFKELIVPELDGMKTEIRELKTSQEHMSKRLDDQNGHLVDISRRIDQVRSELNERIDKLRDTIDGRIHDTNERLDRLYEVIVRREEHEELRQSFHDLDRRVQRLEEKVAVL